MVAQTVSAKKVNLALTKKELREGLFFYAYGSDTIALMNSLVVAVFGLCLGSFVNALVWRLHEQDSRKGKKAVKSRVKDEDLSITKGRSMCPHCHHTLAAKDLVPVFSWLWLRGKCRYCRRAIPDSPIVELSVMVAAVISYLAWPQSSTFWGGLDIASFGLWMFLLTGFAALTVYDLKWYILPDRIVAPLTGIGVVFALVYALSQEDTTQTILGSILGAVLIGGLFYGLFQVSQGKWIGGGDVKLAPLLGLIAGSLSGALLLLFIASLLGTIYSLVHGVIAKQKVTGQTRIPFGPFLIIGAVTTFLWGQVLMDWYTNFLLGI